MTCRVSPGDGGSATKAARDKGREGSQTSVGTVYVRPASPSRQERDTWSGPATVRPASGGGLWVCRARQNAFLDLAAPRRGRGGDEAVQRARAMRPAATRLYSCPSAPRPRRRRIPFGVGCGESAWTLARRRRWSPPPEMGGGDTTSQRTHFFGPGAAYVHQATERGGPGMGPVIALQVAPSGSAPGSHAKRIERRFMMLRESATRERRKSRAS